MDEDIAVIKSSKSADLPTAPGLTFDFAEDQKWKKSDITVTAVASDEIVEPTRFGDQLDPSRNG